MKRPESFFLVDWSQNYSPLSNIPAAKHMRGDNGAMYEQGWMYDFEDGRFQFFNGQLWPMRLVRRVVSTNDGTREAVVWEVIPHTDPVWEAIQEQDRVGRIVLIHEPDRA